MEESCTWVWLGDDWDNTEDTCVPPNTCHKPKTPGLYIGQTQSVPCAP